MALRGLAFLGSVAAVCGLWLGLAGPAAAMSDTCVCHAQLRCEGEACRHESPEAAGCKTFKMTLDRPGKEIKLCRDGVCAADKMQVERTKKGETLLRTSLEWGGGSGGAGTLVVMDAKGGFVYRQSSDRALEVIVGTCESF